MPQHCLSNGKIMFNIWQFPCTKEISCYYKKNITYHRISKSQINIHFLHIIQNLVFMYLKYWPVSLYLSLHFKGSYLSSFLNDIDNNCPIFIVEGRRFFYLLNFFFFARTLRLELQVDSIEYLSEPLLTPELLQALEKNMALNCSCCGDFIKAEIQSLNKSGAHEQYN